MRTRFDLPRGPGFGRQSPLKAVTIIENAFLRARTSFLNRPRCTVRTAVPCSIHSYTRVGSIRFMSPFPVKEREIMVPGHFGAAQPPGATRLLDPFEPTLLALHTRFEHANASNERGLYDLLHRMLSHSPQKRYKTFVAYIRFCSLYSVL